MNLETQRLLIEIAEELEAEAQGLFARWAKDQDDHTSHDRGEGIRRAADVLRIKAGGGKWIEYVEEENTMSRCNECDGTGKRGVLLSICAYCGGTGEIGKGKQGASSAEPEPPVCDVCGRALVVGMPCLVCSSCAKYGPEYLHAAVTPDEEGGEAEYLKNRQTSTDCEHGGGEEFAAALLLRIAEELDEYGSERAAQHLRRHAAKLKEESGD